MALVGFNDFSFENQQKSSTTDTGCPHFRLACLGLPFVRASTDRRPPPRSGFGGRAGESQRRRAGWTRRKAERCGRCGCRAATATPPSFPRTCPAAWPAPPRSTTASRVRPDRAAGAGAGSSRAPASPGRWKALPTVDSPTIERQGEQRSRLVPTLSFVQNGE